MRVTWEVRECSSLYDVLSVQSLQNLGAPKPLEAALHIVIIPFKGLRSKNPADEKERMTYKLKRTDGRNLISL